MSSFGMCVCVCVCVLLAVSQVSLYENVHYYLHYCMIL